VGDSKVEVTLLQYANDTIFVGDMSTKNVVVVVKSILRCFQLIFGLKVNFHKSRFCCIGVKTRVVERFSNYLNYRVLSFSFVYMGNPHWRKS